MIKKDESWPTYNRGGNTGTTISGNHKTILRVPVSAKEEMLPFRPDKPVYRVVLARFDQEKEVDNMIRNQYGWQETTMTYVNRDIRVLSCIICEISLSERKSRRA